jgi:dihydropteridine reductase
MGSRKVLIYGGKGALGSVLVDYFKAKAFWVTSVDFHENPGADCNVVLQQNLGLEQQVSRVRVRETKSHLKSRDITSIQNTSYIYN